MWAAERWVAYYTGDRVYRSDDLTWQELPESGVLLVELLNPTGRTILSGGDWYYMQSGEYGYVKSGEWGTNQPRPDIPCLSCIKEGVGTSDLEFHSLYDRVVFGRVS